MQEMKKRRIVLASLLKPVDDTRMYEKLGATLASEYEVYIIGQPPKKSTAPANVTFISIPAHGRLAIQRLTTPWRVLRRVVGIRPDVLIVCTAELLPIALCARLLTGTKIIYDVQENYAQNILYGEVWPRLMRPWLAKMVRLTEWSTSWLVCHFLLAEQSYADELGFIRKDFTIVENKAVLPSQRPHTEDEKTDHINDIRLLFSGTLAVTTGVFKAIELATQLHDADASIRLHIVGYAAQQDVRISLYKLASENTFIELTGIDHLVPHAEIIKAIGRAHFGIIAYPENKSTWSSYPTKLYEYLASNLPILLIDNPRWISLCAPYSAAVSFPSHAVITDAAPLLALMRMQSFYALKPENVLWDSEAPRLHAAISAIVK
jgi:hypothetical protein